MSRHAVNSSQVSAEHTTKLSAAGEVVPETAAQHRWCADKRTCRKGSLNKWPEKCQTKKGLEFDGLKNKEQIVNKLKYESQLMSPLVTNSSSRPNQRRHLVIPSRQSNLLWYLWYLWSPPITVIGMLIPGYFESRDPNRQPRVPTGTQNGRNRRTYGK